jgi:hypothetical protein
MYFAYGNFRSDLAECTLQVTKENVIEEGVPTQTRVRWTVQGRRHGETVAELISRGRTLELAFTRHNADAALLDVDGSTRVLSLLNAGSINGVRVAQPPHYPKLDGAQLTTFFDWTAVLEAEYPTGFISGIGGGGVASWSESVVIVGNGGPRKVIIETLNGAPQVQTVNQRTKVTARQAGTATGIGRYPTPPPPYFPAWEDADLRSIEYRAPQRQGGQFVVTWSYSYSAPSLLSGRPR